jgi:dTDP-4-dehydrorhamnose 3,5-epimerase
MIFTETRLQGAFIIDIERIEDARGFFARSWCCEEFEKHGMNPNVAQCSLSFNKHKRTLRGLHYQTAPHQEAKLVRCIRGAIHDIIVDLRKDSRTYLQWHAVTLSADQRNALFVPVDFAHGFLTLADNTEVLYQMSEAYRPQSVRGIRWDDPLLAIEWPDTPRVISPKDMGYELLISCEL